MSDEFLNFFEDRKFKYKAIRNNARIHKINQFKFKLDNQTMNVC